MVGTLVDRLNPRSRRVRLEDGATVAVIGGGPAGAFFAIQLLREARRAGRKIDVLILEKKRELSACHGAQCSMCRDGCNYCAGGVSPKLSAILRASGLALPREIIMGEARSLTIHGDWKSIELPMPAGKEMLFAFRGTRPKRRVERYDNFDNFILSRAAEEGAQIITGEVHDLEVGSDFRPIVRYSAAEGPSLPHTTTLEADFVAVAAGVNPTPGSELPTNPLFRAIERIIPGFRPPQVRKALIGEMQVEQRVLRHLRGEVHFAEYGSRDLHIEMSSLIPKGAWMTVALLGKAIDQAAPGDYMRVIERFLDLPHIRRFLPHGATLIPGCVCHPNMTVGTARRPFGERIAVIGDMVVSRLYKDGILSAWLTASALADCIINIGVDRASLRRGYWPAVRQIDRDNRFGRFVFLLNRVTFAHPVLSRIVYQAVATERRAKPPDARRLAWTLWQIATGDDTYGRILLTMFHPATVWAMLAGGMAMTLRNWMTERVFGLDWVGFGRHPTGVGGELVEQKRYELLAALGQDAFPAASHFERMYTIKVMADPPAIFAELAKFGESSRKYFNPRLVHVHRTAGVPNQVGSTIRYDVFIRWMSFSIVLERVAGERFLVYRVRDGFAQGGVLVFDVDQREEGLCLVSIYVAFDFPAGQGWIQRIGWRIFGMLFPAFAHDVLWNHALCELKHVVEVRGKA